MCFGSLIPSPPFLLIYGKYGLKWKIYTKGSNRVLVLHDFPGFIRNQIIRPRFPAFVNRVGVINSPGYHFLAQGMNTAHRLRINEVYAQHKIVSAGKCLRLLYGLG